MTLFPSGTICQLPWWKLSYSLTLISEISSPYNLLLSLPLFSGFSLICSPPVGQFIFLPSTRLFCLCFLPVYYLICDPFLQPIFCFFFSFVLVSTFGAIVAFFSLYLILPPSFTLEFIWPSDFCPPEPGLPYVTTGPSPACLPLPRMATSSPHCC